jgi:hypothetical protein
MTFSQHRNQPARVAGNFLEIGASRVRLDDALDCGELVGAMPARAIADALAQYQQFTGDDFSPQLAVLVFAATRDFRALDLYFPILQVLARDEIDGFYRLVEEITSHRHFDLQLLGEHHTTLTAQMPVGVAQIVAGHIAETFFYRRDILARFLSAPRHFRLYVSPREFKQDGGIAGGDYNPRLQSLQLLLTRLFEGFFGDTPGAAPFLHEFAHMLDAFDARTGKMGKGNGLLPGLHPSDGAIYTPRARKLFVDGKRLELARYNARRKQILGDSPLPIGHPYVFQSDHEFIAGYFEMFFRNPHYFSTQNPVLYQAFVELFGYDPRKAWKQDFSFYVSENRKYYLSGQQPHAAKLRIPRE